MRCGHRLVFIRWMHTLGQYLLFLTCAFKEGVVSLVTKQGQLCLSYSSVTHIRFIVLGCYRVLMRLIERSTDLIKVTLRVDKRICLNLRGHLMLCLHHYGLVRGRVQGITARVIVEEDVCFVVLLRTLRHGARHWFVLLALFLKIVAVLLGRSACIVVALRG